MGKHLVISTATLIFAENIPTLSGHPDFPPTIMGSNSFQTRGPDLDKIKLKKWAGLKKKFLLCHIFPKFLIGFCIYAYQAKVFKSPLSQLPSLLGWELLGKGSVSCTS